VQAPATDAGWLGGHPPPDGTDRGSRRPEATVRALAPPQAALRAPQSLWHSDRPELAPSGGAVDGPCRPRATTALHVGPKRGPTQAHHTRLDSPPPLRLPCERCVRGTRTKKYPTRFPLSTPSPKNLARAVGPLWRGVVLIDIFSFLNDIEKPRLIVRAHVARLSVLSSVLF